MCLTHYQMTNFRLFQTERVWRRQFQVRRKWKKVIQTGRKHCGKRRNCSLRAISPFPTVFKRLVSQGRQKVSLCGNGLKSSVVHFMKKGLLDLLKRVLSQFLLNISHKILSQRKKWQIFYRILKLGSNLLGLITFLFTFCLTLNSILLQETHTPVHLDWPQNYRLSALNYLLYL